MPFARIGIYGAGSIGGFLGTVLGSHGHAVRFLGRPALLASAEAGFSASDFRGRSWSLARPEVVLDVAALAECDLILLTTKSDATAIAARELAALPGSRPVLSFQNGVRNVDRLRHDLPPDSVIAGMVPFNVVGQASGHWHQGTSGDLLLQDGATARDLAVLFRSAGLACATHADLRAVQWGKLLLNLNNGVNALSGRPLRTQLQDGGYRRVLAALMREGLDVLRRARIPIARAGPLPPSWVPWVLDLPDALFAVVARSMLRLDAEARSSMWEDLQRGRRTEIAHLNGEIVALAKTVGADAELNQAMVDWISEAEQGGVGSPGVSPDAMWAGLLQRSGRDPGR